MSINTENLKGASLPGVFAEGWEFKELLPELNEALINRGVLALRIAGQPPYGYVFRVDDVELVRRVWRAKGRLKGESEIDLSKKPVTSLSQDHLERFIDWEKLCQFGFKKEIVMQLLDLHVHTVLSVNENIPAHLTLPTNYGPTVSTMRFPEGDLMRMLVDSVAEVDSTVIVGGTSLNPTGYEPFVDTEDLVKKMSVLDTVDLFVLSKDPRKSNMNLGAFHPMIALQSQGIKVLRQGIDFEEIVHQIEKMELRMIES